MWKGICAFYIKKKILHLKHTCTYVQQVFIATLISITRHFHKGSCGQFSCKALFIHPRRLRMFPPPQETLPIREGECHINCSIIGERKSKKRKSQSKGWGSLPILLHFPRTDLSDLTGHLLCAQTCNDYHIHLCPTSSSEKSPTWNEVCKGKSPGLCQPSWEQRLCARCQWAAHRE